MSNINPFSINGSYPIAGQDNDTQGFRDNFTNIRNNLLFAKEEIEALQNGELTQTTGVKHTASTFMAMDHGYSSSVALQFDQAHLHAVATNSNLNVTMAGWPAGGLEARMQLWVTVSNITHVMTLPATVTVGRDEIGAGSGYAVTFPAIGQYLFEFITHDGGTNVTVSELTKKLFSAKITKPAPINSIGNTGDMPGMMAYNSSYLYLCVGAYDGTTPIWKRAIIGESVAYIDTTDNVSAVFGWQENAEDSRVQLWINVTNVAHKLILPATTTVGTAQIAGFNPTTREITFPAIGHYLFEFITHNGGTNVAICEMTKKLSVKAAPATALGVAGDQPGMMAYDANSMYVCVGVYDASTPIWKKTALTAM